MNVIINCNKPKGITSQQAVTRIKKILGVKKAGHAGTLDPLATGVLLVCLGEATKITSYLMDKDKEYKAIMKLGERTDTLDAEGTITEIQPVPPLSFRDITEAARGFLGRIVQRPPMYSALKHQGRPLYELARKGVIVERPERPVEIHHIAVTCVELPFVGLTITCSKGTYIRTLCDDLGVRLGTLAHLVSLERTRTGLFAVERAAQIDQISSSVIASPSPPFIHTLDNALSEFTEILLSEDDHRKARNGISLSIENLQEIPACAFIRLKSPSGKLFGIGRIDNEQIAIERIFHV